MKVFQYLFVLHLLTIQTTHTKDENFIKRNIKQAYTTTKTFICNNPKKIIAGVLVVAGIGIYLHAEEKKEQLNQLFQEALYLLDTKQKEHNRLDPAITQNYQEMEQFKNPDQYDSSIIV